MKELKRIFGNRRLTLCLLLVFLINGILFLGAQRSQDFGLDLSGRLPAPSPLDSAGRLKAVRQRQTAQRAMRFIKNGWQKYKVSAPKRRNLDAGK